MKLQSLDDSYREDFFSVSAIQGGRIFGELVIASPINIEIANDLRNLGQEFGIGITSYGLDNDTSMIYQNMEQYNTSLNVRLKVYLRLINYQKFRNLDQETNLLGTG